MIGTAPPPGSNVWIPIFIRSNGTHLDLYQHGVLCQSGVTGPGGVLFSGPVPSDWEFGFSSGASGPEPHRIANVQLRSVAFLTELRLPLSESQNGVQFGESDVEFTFLPPPAVWSANPSSVSFFGGATLTLRGANLRLGDDIRCRFSAPSMGMQHLIVPASMHTEPNALRCVTPRLSGTSPWVFITVTLNGQQFSAEGVNMSVYGTALHPGARSWALRSTAGGFNSTDLVGLSLWPPLGPVKGDTTLQLHGIDFAGGSLFTCRFTSDAGTATAEVHEVAARLLSTVEVAALYHRHVAAANATALELALSTWLHPSALLLRVCQTPPHTASYEGNSTLVEFSANGQQFHSSPELRFNYYQACTPQRSTWLPLLRAVRLVVDHSALTTAA